MHSRDLVLSTCCQHNGKKNTITCFLPSGDFSNNSFNLELFFLFVFFFFPRNIPTPYETNRMEHGVKPNFSDSKLPVCSPTGIDSYVNNVFSASLHYNQCTSLFSLHLKLVQGILMFIHAIHYTNLYIEVSKTETSSKAKPDGAIRDTASSETFTT